MRNIILSILILVLYSCKPALEDRVVTNVNIDGRKIPVIHFDNLPEEAVETGISEIIDDYQVIPLETKDECLVGNAMTYLFEDKIIIETQIDFPGPVTCYMFDKDGTFIKEVGAGGNGPGEHTGYSLSSLFPILDTNMFVLNFMTEIQLFSNAAEYIDDVKQPYELMSNSVSYDSDNWYSPGSVKGHPNYPRDSILLVIHNRNGEIIKRIPRTEYPPSADKGYSPSINAASLHTYNNKWFLYSAGNDTVYSLSGESVVKEYIFDRGETGQKYNEIVDAGSMIGKYSYSVATETDDQWFISCSEMTKADINEYRPGQWSGRYDFSDDMAIIDKHKNKASRIQVIDDLFGLIDSRSFNSKYYFTISNKIVFAQQAPDLKVKIAEKLKEDDLDPDQRKGLQELDSQIYENSNPVIFIFSLKDKIEI